MTSLLSQIVFMQPFILTALMALPILWYLLRVTPPAPKNIFFPATRFLENLNSEEQTPSKTPWWILLLRLAIAALVIIALARPVINPSGNIEGQGNVRLIIDNGWAAAQNWDKQIKAAKEIIAQAGREKRDIYIITTTSDKQLGAFTSSDAISTLRGLTPNPWAADYKKLAQIINNNKTDKTTHTMWLSHGLDEGGIDKAIKAAQKQGGVSYILPAPEHLPLILRPATKSSKKEQSDIRINIDAPSNIKDSLPVTIQAMGQGGDIIDAQQLTLSATDLPQTIYFEVLESLKNKITKFKISGNKSAGGLFLLDDQFKKRNIGIAAPPKAEQASPLIEASYYLKRAAKPFSNIKIGDIQSLIDAELSVIILPDIAAMPSDTLNNLEKWVKDGGLLLRFAGEKMAKSREGQFLMPVILRSGERSLAGSLSWDEPQKISPFTQRSPFYGLEIPDNITIKQQILADPAQDLENKVWASLEDGTPFITAKPLDKGLIVLIHTSANTDWSNFAISGLYVSVIKRIIRLSGNSDITVNSNYEYLDPLLIMDGFGNLIPPKSSAHPIATGDLGKIVPSEKHPPGLYGKGQMQYALNIGTNAPKLKATSKLPSGVSQSYYEKEYEIDIKPIILSIALVLFLIDWIVMIFISGNLTKIIRKLPIGMIALCLFIQPAIATEKQDLKYANNLYLAYIKTGDTSLDTLANRGLKSLSKALSIRTSVEPAGVAAINPDKDELAFFPLIYWIITENGTSYSDKAMLNIQNYLDNGGTIIFDTRDQNQSTGSFSNTPNAKALRQITASLNIPPITPIAEDHVLGRSFYLLDKYPGRYSSGTLWVEKYSANGRDNVSSVLIGSNDWVGSWADAAEQKEFSRYTMDTSSRQKELSLRFGINLMMYALTGNYKADQVHISHILERLGK